MSKYLWSASCLPIRRADTRYERITDCIHLFDRNGETRLSFEQCMERNLGLNLRGRQVRRCISFSVRGHSKMRWETETDAIIPLAFSDARLWMIVEKMAEQLLAIATRPLTPRELLAALPISNKERLRWTKDGRLPRSGAVTIRRGHLIAVPTYRVADVEQIRANLSVVEAWREFDGATIPPHFSEARSIRRSLSGVVAKAPLEK